MLRSVCFKNFVKFKDYQILDFSDSGVVNFIGENGSGKSSVLEGIRRTLKAELSTSVSSSVDPSRLSYFICNFAGDATEEENVMDNVISGIVVMPEKIEKIDSESETDESLSDFGTDDLFGETETQCLETHNEEKRESHETQDLSKEEENVSQTDTLENNTGEISDETLLKANTDMVKSVYKFVMRKSGPMHVNLMQITHSTEGGSRNEIMPLNDIRDEDFKDKRHNLHNFINAVIEQKRTDKHIEKYLCAVFDSKYIQEHNKQKQEKQVDDCKTLLESLSSKIVFTFPLRSIGPLQWSESKRIHHDQRENNYSEAEKRCEIIKCYLEDNGTKFNKDTEQDIFKTITQCDDYKFELKNGQITLPKGKYALLKTPEGILEAKAFSILLSGKTYRTIILEEPDRGMHPQYIERMMQVINRYKHNKRVILTTHNTSLITPWTLPNCFVFKRQNESYRVISGRAIVGAPTKDNVRMKKLRLMASDHISDILFAKKVLFFEGDSELLFLTEFRRQILSDELTDITIFRDNEMYKQLKSSLLEVSLVKMNGKRNASFCHDVCSEHKLNLGHIIIVDRDGIKDEEETNEEAEPEENRKDEDVELQTKAKTLHGGKEEGLEEDQNESTWTEERKGLDHEEDQKNESAWTNERKELMKKKNVFFWLHGDIEDMVMKMSSTTEGLLGKLENQNVSLDKSLYQRKKKRHHKLFLRKGVTISNITEGVKCIFEHCTTDHDLFQLITYLKRDNWNTFSD
ncbi:uncharacterized protein LOC123557254 [Mercenaria mercenaria]|uniref:uncharacterized protein LOC123557254 n=1 Tax=Mercenaria mercenaria TaxID=6596 RepID=UPI00234EE9C1|nr:uncharacterized protein LOC123557254 [Mercenaria mercenaria]